jgi:hypothetical protein
LSGVTWGSIADWVSGIGSLSAAIVALYVAHTSSRVKLRGYCGIRAIVGTGTPQFDVFAVSATNISQRPTTITNIGFSVGIWRWKKNGLILFMHDDISQGIPLSLNDGETGNWNVRLGKDNEWAKDLVEKYKLNTFYIYTMRFLIHTSNGGTTIFRPEKSFRDLLKKLKG